MTTDIERQFFETFNIEKRQVDCGQPVRLGCENKDCKTCKYSVYEYPQITDRILLELIMIVFDYCYEDDIYDFNTNDLVDFKADILEFLITLVEPTNFHEVVYQQVQSLFKER